MNKLTFHKIKVLKINREMVDRSYLGQTIWSDVCEKDSSRWHAKLGWKVKCVEEKELVLPAGWRWSINWQNKIIVTRPNNRSHYAEDLIDEDSGQFINPHDLIDISEL